eukprot:CAMPEP_0194276572 /NCGR_PEP_ID=MMETSP0169-20130528/9126_1 /TAXON_ID=218684 /ORGANISM="Corethron pennatum, Strain L29A3" /LENGTH=1199 /DNA_ID=CAMNT_0039020315 /DNA_START=42 /DNA_END=3641 /DNA_ORIENTATION=+
MSFDYVFGFGSIINTDTHAPWVSGVISDGKALQGQRASIRPSFGYRRGWNFRSNTGFTALGIVKDETGGTAINGVLFRIPHSMFAGFDRREVGYDRVAVGRDHFELIPLAAEGGDGKDVALDIRPTEKVWVYVPQASFRCEANEEYPILQSYVDTVMQGCLSWGGEDMAKSFVATTAGWSPYFLNDTPSSRRPWLFRREYNVIDKILRGHPATHYADRRHPEEFASAFLLKMMRGTWAVPRRNTVFTGREEELGQIHSRLTTTPAGQHLRNGIGTLEVTGMGGVGKTQICTEYCYRYFPLYYGLVIWLSAQSAETVAACYRQLMSDTTGMDVQDKDTDEVVAEVKARLFRSKVPWLLVFDNLEDRSLLEKFVPHGGSCGHVLVTTNRLVDTNPGSATMMLGCFNPSESVDFLERSANICGAGNISAANKLANQLGHLPLALSMAGSYMQRCDVDCSEYLARYIDSGSSSALLGHQAVVASSLKMSLDAIKKENPTAWETLHLLGWLGPDQINKTLVRSLFRAKEAQAKSDAESEAQEKALFANFEARCATTKFLLGSLALSSLSLALLRRRLFSRIPASVGIVTALFLSASATISVSSKRRQVVTSVENRGAENTANTLNTSRRASFSPNEFEQTDLIWKILKSFSLLVVKDAKGSIHRLLAQALRMSQNEKDSRRNLAVCAQAVQHWSFKPEQVDTWQDAGNMLEHVKAVVFHTSELNGASTLETAILSREAGVFSAMALNRFNEAQCSLELSLKILEGIDRASAARTRALATTLHELGRVFRYQGKFRKSEEALRRALASRNEVAATGPAAQQGVAATLHELGVLEIKKHRLDSAESFLRQALDLRHVLDLGGDTEMEAQLAATLHQLAAVQVARKPPLLDKAWGMLQEALGLNMQIGQRAATLKQLARVAIRRGEFDSAEKSLAQALELYVELYGEKILHINVAAVKFQQGALAFHREQFEQAWIHYSECLRARRHVYAYSQGNHLEVSSTLHELGCVAYSQNRIGKAAEMLHAEKEILNQLCEANSAQQQQMLQARLTNLTWLRKCAKKVGDEEGARKIAMERTSLKSSEKHQEHAEAAVRTNALPLSHDAVSLQRELLCCRLLAREFALGRSKGTGDDADSGQLRTALAGVSREIEKCLSCPMKDTAVYFHKVITESLSRPKKWSSMLDACDELRDTLREYGLQVHDTVQSKTH